MHFHSEITIRRPDGSVFPPIGLLHEDDDVLSGILFLQSMGRQMAWHRNGELSGLQLQVTPTPEPESARTGSRGAASLSPPSHKDLDDAFSFLDSPACCPNGAQRP
ncbi:hypothetical protein KBY86_02410 [Synechococcus sp. Lug-A]|uniref:hypothetical protein n=1 Tax=Synechococcus sp. Lug-A TaxID=2823740 RepID=UPI0020CD0B43|nr:hypothetical protein [Synechococcus sp. Lug-A]MCP9845750.1 hypothetical protein [Synechococcus sp. Lug-A]